MLKVIFQELFKLLVGLVILVGIGMMLSGHAQHVKRQAMGMNMPVTYHAPVQHELVCNGAVVAKGVVKYEGGVNRQGAASNSNGIWRVDGAVYKQREGELCGLRGK